MWQFGLRDILDILAVATLMYWLYRKTRENGTIVIFQGLISVIVIWLLVSQVIRMRLMGAILDQIVSVSMIVVVILFQNEIRQGLIRMGSRKQWSSMLRFFGRDAIEREVGTQWADDVVMACKNMSDQKVGALIIVQHEDEVEPLTNNGCHIDAVVSRQLVEQIFVKNTPLHDGAMIIRDGRITVAAAYLPISTSNRIPTEWGTRHRSAIGISEKCDARVIIVSEETGAISTCHRGRWTRDVTPAALKKQLLNKK